MKIKDLIIILEQEPDQDAPINVYFHELCEEGCRCGCTPAFYGEELRELSLSDIIIADDADGGGLTIDLTKECE